MVGHMHICETCVMTDDPLADALRAFRRAEAALDKRRAELADAIGDAVYGRGVRQADVARQTGYTREHIRRICKDYVDRQISRETPAPF